MFIKVILNKPYKHIIRGIENMKKKIIYSLIFCTFLFGIITSFSFAANETTMQNSANNMANTMDAVGNKIENGARIAGNTMQDAGETVGNTMENTGKTIGNGMENAGVAVRNTTGNIAMAVTNETAINPANQGNTFLGLTSTAWMWIIVIVIIVIIISLIVKYAQNNDEHDKE